MLANNRLLEKAFHLFAYGEKDLAKKTLGQISADEWRGLKHSEYWTAAWFFKGWYELLWTEVGSQLDTPVGFLWLTYDPAKIIHLQDEVTSLLDEPEGALDSYLHTLYDDYNRDVFYDYFPPVVAREIRDVGDGFVSMDIDKVLELAKQIQWPELENPAPETLFNPDDFRHLSQDNPHE